MLIATGHDQYLLTHYVLGHTLADELAARKRGLFKDLGVSAGAGLVNAGAYHLAHMFQRDLDSFPQQRSAERVVPNVLDIVSSRSVEVPSFAGLALGPQKRGDDIPHLIITGREDLDSAQARDFAPVDFSTKLPASLMSRGEPHQQSPQSIPILLSDRSIYDTNLIPSQEHNIVQLKRDGPPGQQVSIPVQIQLPRDEEGFESSSLLARSLQVDRSGKSDTFASNEARQLLIPAARIMTAMLRDEPGTTTSEDARKQPLLTGKFAPLDSARAFAPVLDRSTSETSVRGVLDTLEKGAHFLGKVVNAALPRRRDDDIGSVPDYAAVRHLTSEGGLS